MSELVIQTQHLTRRFGDIMAVNGVNLCVPLGSVYGFLGPNGAGKTTTIRMLLGLIKPNSGLVHLFGHDMAIIPYRRVLLNYVGALVEQPSLYGHLTGRENLEVTRRLLNAPRSQIDRVLEIVKLQGAANRVAQTYSQGMKQRLGLALALLNSPQLLILDEPTNGLDPAGIHEMRDLIRSFPEAHGMTVFLSSHLLGEIEQMATHLGIINQGRLIFQGTLAELNARQPPYLRIGVEPRTEAGQFLMGKGWKVVADDTYLKVAVAQPQDAATINRVLVQEGFAVSHVSMEQNSLERLFLQMTGDGNE